MHGRVFDGRELAASFRVRGTREELDAEFGAVLLESLASSAEKAATLSASKGTLRISGFKRESF